MPGEGPEEAPRRHHAAFAPLHRQVSSNPLQFGHWLGPHVGCCCIVCCRCKTQEVLLPLIKRFLHLKASKKLVGASFLPFGVESGLFALLLGRWLVVHASVCVVRFVRSAANGAHPVGRRRYPHTFCRLTSAGLPLTSVPVGTVLCHRSCAQIAEEVGQEACCRRRRYLHSCPLPHPCSEPHLMDLRFDLLLLQRKRKQPSRRVPIARRKTRAKTRPMATGSRSPRPRRTKGTSRKTRAMPSRSPRRTARTTRTRPNPRAATMTWTSRSNSAIRTRALRRSASSILCNCRCLRGCARSRWEC